MKSKNSDYEMMVDKSHDSSKVLERGVDFLEVAASVSGVLKEDCIEDLT